MWVTTFLNFLKIKIWDELACASISYIIDLIWVAGNMRYCKCEIFACFVFTAQLLSSVMFKVTTKQHCNPFFLHYCFSDWNRCLEEMKELEILCTNEQFTVSPKTWWKVKTLKIWIIFMVGTYSKFVHFLKKISIYWHLILCLYNWSKFSEVSIPVSFKFIRWTGSMSVCFHLHEVIRMQ